MLDAQPAQDILAHSLEDITGHKGHVTGGQLTKAQASASTAQQMLGLLLVRATIGNQG